MIIEQNLNNILASLRAAEQSYHRPARSVSVLAVSKKQTMTKILEAYGAGQRDFGENYVSEALQKIETCPRDDIIWHFIGTIQTNKTKAIAENFAWVHSLSSLKQARRLNEQRPENKPALNVCLQVKLSTEETKAGIPPDEVETLAEAIKSFDKLRLRGLMTLPAPSNEPAEQRAVFARLRQIFEVLKAKGFALDTLSMGMSNDYLAAIAEGATMVRIGTALFGSRVEDE